MKDSPKTFVPANIWFVKSELIRLKYSPTILVLSITRWFNPFSLLQQPETHDTLRYGSCSLNYQVVPAVRLGCSIPNSWKIFLRSLFLPLLSSSSSSVCFNHHKHMRNYPIILLFLIHAYFKQFGWVELPWTHERIFYNLCYFNYLVIQAVRQERTTPNSWNILLQS